VLIFKRGDTTDRIWFYDMEHDGYSLDDKRQKTEENDIPDILLCWQYRIDEEFARKRTARLQELKAEIAPLKAERLNLHKEINRLTFESIIAPEGDEQARLALEADQEKLARLEEQIAPLQREINQLTRQFWVSKEQVKANKYDLSASRYRQVERDDAFYENPDVTLNRLSVLEREMSRGISELKELI
jgi:type I restriction enzyme M protein